MDSSRREFLGFLGLVLLGSPVSTADGQDEAEESGPVYLGPVRELAESVPLEPGWELTFDTLIESIDLPSEWVLSFVTKDLLTARYPHADLPSLLRSWGVRRNCEVDYCQNKDRMRGSFFADVTQFENVRQCKAAWRRCYENLPDEAGLELRQGIGEAALVSRGKWSLPGKVFFRRGNVLVSVVPFTPDRDARELAAAFDQRVVALSQNDRKIW